MNQSQIRGILYSWLKKELGTRQVFTVTFDADFVTGNVIAGSFGGDAFSVNFDTNQVTTLEALRRAIQDLDSIFKCQVTAARELTCTVLQPGTSPTLTGPTVTGGASQAIATILETVEPYDMQVVFAEQVSALKPLRPFATIRMGNFVKLGWDELRDFDSETCIAQMGGQRRATVEINFFGDNSFTEMSKIYNSLEKFSIISYFSQNGIGLGDKNSVQNLTTVLESKWEERAFFDFFILYADNYEDDTGIIETVEIDGRAFQDGSFLPNSYSVELSGSGQYIQTPISVDPSANSFTVLTSVLYRALAVSPTTGLPIDNVAFYAQQDGSGTGREWLGIRFNTSTQLLRTTTNFNNIFRNANHVPPSGRWEIHGVRYNVDTQILSIFIEGLLDIQYTNITPEAASGLHRIGLNKSGINGLNGFVGPTCFYKRDLDDEEIFQFCKNLIVPESRSTDDFCYLMRKAGGDVIDELNGNHGTIVGGSWADFIFNGFTTGPIETSDSITA